MFDNHIKPRIKKFFAAVKEPPCVELAIGDVSESAAAEALQPVMEKFPDAEFTILASPAAVRFFARTGNCKSPEEAAAEIRRLCYKIFGKNIFGENGATLETALGDALRKRKFTLATAESCTGGLIAQLITGVPGSSDYFLGGVVAYSNAAKKKFLGVTLNTLGTYGAVSNKAAFEMARGVRRAFNADWGLSITGIAGPGGGTDEKPVGLVYIGAVGPGGEGCVMERRFGSSRANNNAYAAASALNMMRELIG